MKYWSISLYCFRNCIYKGAFFPPNNRQMIAISLHTQLSSLLKKEKSYTFVLFIFIMSPAAAYHTIAQVLLWASYQLNDFNNSDKSNLWEMRFVSLFLHVFLNNGMLPPRCVQWSCVYLISFRETMESLLCSSCFKKQANTKLLYALGPVCLNTCQNCLLVIQTFSMNIF